MLSQCRILTSLNRQHYIGKHSNRKAKPPLHHGNTAILLNYQIHASSCYQFVKSLVSPLKQSLPSSSTKLLCSSTMSWVTFWPRRSEISTRKLSLGCRPSG